MATQIKPRKYFGISRIDQPEKKSHGWYVRVKSASGRLVTKFFADGLHGSRRRSFEAAETYRDTLFNSLPAKQQERASKPRNAGRKAA